jgi:hypothetical protein
MRLIGRAFAPNRPGLGAPNRPCLVRLIGRANSQTGETKKGVVLLLLAAQMLRLIGRASGSRALSGGFPVAILEQ